MTNAYGRDMTNAYGRVMTNAYGPDMTNACGRVDKATSVLQRGIIMGKGESKKK